MNKRQAGRPSPAVWRWMGERGLRVATGPATLARYAALVAGHFPEVEDVIPADDSVLVILCPGATVSAELQAALAAPLADPALPDGARHDILVEYGGAAGPDLAALARQARMEVASFIAAHAATEHIVAFLGFQPGFPYLRGLPPVLQASRRASPRVEVAGGSVAIGGAYTGIYPARGPGGWNIIGRTAAVLFDPRRDPPALFRPGDRVRFIPA